MSNTKLGIVNQLVTAQNPAITGVAHNDLGEVAPYLASNLFHFDRYTWWRTPSLNLGTYVLDFNMGGTPTIGAAAACCFSLLEGSAPTIDVYTQTGPYTFAGTWTLQGSLTHLSASVKDDWVEFAPVSTCHSIRFTFNVLTTTSAFRFGNFFAGTLTDLGGVYTRGGNRQQFQNRAERKLPSGVPSITVLGDPGALYSFPWAAASPTVQTALYSAFANGNYPLLLVDEKPSVCQGILNEGKLRDALVMGSTYDMDFEIEKLP